MKRTAILASVALAGIASAQEPLSVSYTWSGSGQEYALVGRNIEPVSPGSPVSLALFVGTEVKGTKATVWGPGVTYAWVGKGGFYAGASAAVLFGPLKPDVTFGVTFGVKF